MYITLTKLKYITNITYRSSISAYKNTTIYYHFKDNIPNRQPIKNLKLFQNRINNKDIASASKEKEQSPLSNPMQKQIPYTPA